MLWHKDRVAKLWRGDGSMDKNIVLSAKGICMTFPGVKALQNVDFNLRKGEIRALLWAKTAPENPH